MFVSAGPGVAVREFPLTTGDADYMLYADARAIGVVEAKPKGHTLTGVETQSGKYLDGLPAGLPHHRLPLPFAYESTGEVTQFATTLETDARSRAVFTLHRPEEGTQAIGQRGRCQPVGRGHGPELSGRQAGQVPAPLHRSPSARPPRHQADG